jgi:3-oxoadipate enol-lactonase
VLCVHGVPGSRRDFRYLAPLLAEGLRVVRVEMPGFGETPRNGPATVAGWGRALLAVAGALGAARVVVLSHSFGGGGALHAAATGGERVAALVLLATMGLRRHRAFLFPPLVYRAQAMLLAVPAFRGIVHAAAGRIYTRIGLPAPEDWRGVETHLLVLASVRFAALARAAARIESPAMLFQALDDRLVEPAIPRELAAVLPCAELVEYASGGHHIQKTRAAEIAAAVLERLA